MGARHATEGHKMVAPGAVGKAGARHSETQMISREDPIQTRLAAQHLLLRLLELLVAQDATSM